MKISLVILTKNEIDGVRVIVPRIPRDAVDEICAIDGASVDGTPEFISAQGIRVISQKNRGRGAAILDGAANTTGDAIIFFSPDGNEDPADIPKFRALLEAGNDLVIASRMMRGARNEEDDKFLRLRKWANLAFGLMANLAFRREGRFVTDTINGFRAVRRDSFQKLGIDAQDYTIEYQTTMRAFKSRLKIAEFPTAEGHRIGGETGAKSIPTGLRFLKCFFREFGRY